MLRALEVAVGVLGKSDRHHVPPVEPEHGNEAECHSAVWIGPASMALEQGPMAVLKATPVDCAKYGASGAGDQQRAVGIQ
jgi:hypothetical protein